MSNLMLVFVAALVSLGAIHALWFHYVAVMALKRARDAGSLTKVQTYFGYPVLFVGLILDFVINVVLMSIFLIEFPKEWTVSGRLARHTRIDYDETAEAPEGRMDRWRYVFCHAIRSTLLDSIDPKGIHLG